MLAGNSQFPLVRGRAGHPSRKNPSGNWPEEGGRPERVGGGSGGGGIGASGSGKGHVSTSGSVSNQLALLGRKDDQGARFLKGRGAFAGKRHRKQRRKSSMRTGRRSPPLLALGMGSPVLIHGWRFAGESGSLVHLRAPRDWTAEIGSFDADNWRPVACHPWNHRRAALGLRRNLGEGKGQNNT